MKYKCLILDHDDTVVDSTATIHYPCFIEYLKLNYPHLVGNYTLRSYFLKNFHTGIVSLLCDEIGMSRSELKSEEHFWSEYVKSHTPSAFSGMKEIITDFKAAGGIIAVSSHSLTEYIRRDYIANSLPMPDIIFGWDIPEEKRKPAPDTVLEVMKKYSLSPSEVLVVDDLKPGYDMARAAGVHFAAAGWAYDVPEIEEFMKKSCDYYFKTVSQLKELLKI